MKIKLSTKIISIAGTMLLLLMVVMAVYQYAITSTAKGFENLMATEVELASHAHRIREFMSGVSRDEKNFLFIKDKKYSAAVQEGMGELQKEIGAIELLADRSSYDAGKQKAAAIKGHANEYVKSFEGVVSAVEAKGLDKDSGLQGQFAAIANRLARDLQGYQVEDLFIGILQMRRYEKDYIVSESDKDKRYLLESIEKYRALLEKSKSEGESLKTQKEALVEYTDLLKQYIAAAESKGTDQAVSPKTVIYRGLKMRASKMEEALARIYVPRAAELLLEIRFNERNYLLFHDKKYVQATHDSIVQLNDAVKKAGIIDKYALTAQKALAEYKKTFDALVEKDDGIEALVTTMTNAAAKIQQQVDEIVKNAEAMATAKTIETTAKANTYAFIAICVGVGAIVIGILLSFLIIRSTTRPINEVIEGLNEAAEQVTAGSAQVSASSQQLADGTSQQAAAIEQTSSSLEEIASMTKQNAENAGHANQLAIDVNRIVGQADQSMALLNTSMGNISSESEETRKIIKTIDEIAFQTNLLALNAAVEAARAGEAGAGFAVVADEVRNLAMRAAEAAKSTASLIDGIVRKIKDGVDLVARTNVEFREVAASVRKTGELVGEIAAASHEQAQGIDQLNKAAADMDRVTQQNAANAEESASASEEMNAQAGYMKEFVAQLVVLAHGGSGEESGEEPEEAWESEKPRLRVVAPVASRVCVKQPGNGQVKARPKAIETHGVSSTAQGFKRFLPTARKAI